MSYAVDKAQRSADIARMRRQLDPEAASADLEAKLDDPSHQPSAFMMASTKEIWLYALDPQAGQKIFVQFPYYAAVRLVERTHREAEQHEIDTFKSAQDKQRIKALSEADKKANPGIDRLTDALSGLVKAGRTKQPEAA